MVRVAQVHRPTTRAHVETHLRRHAYQALGDRSLYSVRPSDVQAWTAGLTAALAPRTVGTVHGIVSGIFRTAGRDRLIVSNPCEGTRLPKVSKAQVEPLPLDVVQALELALPGRYRALVRLAAGTGLRQGECLGLTTDRVDFLRRVVTVDRQLVTVVGREPFLAPPKTSASVRAVQARLGHASAAETLDTYSHLWPDSDDRTRAAVDAVLFADSVRTEEVGI